jgi:hypothetical protein
MGLIFSVKPSKSKFDIGKKGRGKSESAVDVTILDPFKIGSAKTVSSTSATPYKAIFLTGISKSLSVADNETQDIFLSGVAKSLSSTKDSLFPPE